MRGQARRGRSPCAPKSYHDRHRRARPALPTHPDPRRRDGHDDPAPQAGGGATSAASGSRRTRTTSRATTTCSCSRGPTSSATSTAQYLEAGADIIETNTFNAQRDLAGATTASSRAVYELNVAGARARPRGRRRVHGADTRTSRGSSPARSARRTGRCRSRRTSTTRRSAAITFDQMKDALRSSRFAA